MIPMRIELCRDRFGNEPRIEVIAVAPDRVELLVSWWEGHRGHASLKRVETFLLSRGDLAMLRGLLANVAEAERAMIAAGQLVPFDDPDTPAGRSRPDETQR